MNKTFITWNGIVQVDDSSYPIANLPASNGSYYWRFSVAVRRLINGKMQHSYYMVSAWEECEFIDCIPEEIGGGDYLKIEGIVTTPKNSGQVFLNATKIEIFEKSHKQRSMRWS